MYSKGQHYVLLQFLFIGLIFLSSRKLPFFFEAHNSLSFIFFLFGFVLLITSARSLKKNLTFMPHPKKQSSLITTGPYLYIRHPMYLSVMMFGLAWSFFVQSFLSLIFAFLLIILLYFKAKKEEFWLEKKFPEYLDYKKKTKLFIPFLL